jgi:hypothetical protein
MEKTIQFELNNFAQVPNKLRKTVQANSPAESFDINLARLYYHRYHDSWSTAPPDPDYANCEYLRFLANCDDFRFIGNGPAANTGKKRSMSNELGQAFLRYFLHEFCGLTYFAHMNQVLNKSTHPAFGGMRIERKTKGDVPDYLCAYSVSKPFIAEAKGRFSQIRFTSSDFDSWRKQFSRIIVLDHAGISRRLKGYIVATRFTTEKDANAQAKVLIEDPETEGDRVLAEDQIGIGRACIALHYARLLFKLGFPLLSQSLDHGFVVPPDIQFVLPIWRCMLAPMKHLEFVGGILGDELPRLFSTPTGTVRYLRPSFLTGERSPVFIGLEVKRFASLRKVSLGAWEEIDNIEQLEDIDFRPSDVAWLQDGSISGRLDYFEITGTQTF